MMDFSAVREHNVARVSAGKLASCAYIVSVGGEIVTRGEIGYSDYENRVPLRRSAMFRLASMTKPVVAACVMLQCQRGLLSIDDPLSKFMPAFADMKVGKLENGAVVTDHAAKNPILLRHLLTHSSGLGSGPVGDAVFPRFAPRGSDTLSDVIPRLADMPLDFEPGSATAYSGLFAFDTLAHVVELTSGVPFPEFLRANILDPLGISDITYFPDADRLSRIPAIYAAGDGGLTRVEMPSSNFGDIPRSYTSGGAGLLGSVDAYHRFASMLLDGGGILLPETIAQMRVPQQPSLPDHDGDAEKWGLGMRVITGDNILPLGCYGWSGAYGTHFWIDPAQKLVAVYMSNLTTAQGSGADTAREFERDIMSALRGLKIIDTATKKRYN